MPLRKLPITLLLAALCACAPAVPAGTDELPYVVESSSFALQAQVDAVAAGGTLELPPGEYPGARLHRPIRIVGAGIGRTVVRDGFDVGRQGGVHVSDLTLLGAGEGTGIGGEGTGDFTLERVEVRGWRWGIGVYGSLGPVTVRASRIVGNTFGVDISEAAGRVVNCEILDNTWGGIVARSFGDVVAVHNTLVGNGFAGDPDGGAGAITFGPFGNSRAYNNLIVGNRYGLNCMRCRRQFSHNLIWGNSENHAGDAGPAPADVRRDPRLVEPGEGDYSLADDSPAIDAGRDMGVTTDFADRPRPDGDAPDIGAHERVRLLPTIVVNEVMANPRDERRDEFVELFNAGDVAVDLAGWVLADGDADDRLRAAGGGTLLAAGGYAVILDPDYAGGYDIPGDALLLTVAPTGLGNGLAVGDPVRIRLPDSGPVVSAYAAPFNPGNGVSAERVSVDGPDGAPGTWRASPCQASPGRRNCIRGRVEGPADVVITEVMANPTDEGSGEFVELLNRGAAPVDLAGWVVSDGDRQDILVPAPGRGDAQGGGMLLLPGRYALVLDPDHPDPPGGALLLTVSDAALGNGLSVDDIVTVSDAAGVVQASYSFPFDPGNGRSVEIADPAAGDVQGNWRASGCPGGPDKPAASPGLAGCPSGLLINEVMANPLDEDRDEFVELFNAGDEAIELAGLVLSDGDATDVLATFDGGPTVLMPAGFAVIVDPEYAGLYRLPADAVVMAPAGNTTVGSGLATNDPISVLTAQGVELALFDTPFNPGNGVSAERLADGGWVASPCASGASPGRPNCAGGAAGGGADVQPPDLIINEVMANPVVESTGEFVELFNRGDEAVDLAGFVLTDDDATDTITPYQGGTTLLPAGGFAVIVDRDYQGQHPISEDAVVVTVDDRTLGNALSTSDPVRLLMPFGEAVVSTFSFPLNPGNGVSVERGDPDGPDAPGNWSAARCEGGFTASPGYPNCNAGWEPEPADDPDPACVPAVQSLAPDDASRQLNELWQIALDDLGWGDSPAWQVRNLSYADCLDVTDGGQRSALVGAVADALFRWDRREVPHLGWWWDALPRAGDGRMLRSLDDSESELEERIEEDGPVPQAFRALANAYHRHVAGVRDRVTADPARLSWHLDTDAVECTEEIEIVVLPGQRRIVVLWEGPRC